MNISESADLQVPSTPGRWRLIRRVLLAAAAVVAIFALLYVEEDWRGRRAWETCRRELEAKGEVLDWKAYIPAPVPDAQNVFKAPKMEEWFVKDSPFGGKPGASPRAVMSGAGPFTLWPHKETGLVVAEVRIDIPGTSAGTPPVAPVLRFNDPAAREQAAKLIHDAIGPCAIGSQSRVFIAPPLNQFKPLRLVLQADNVPATTQLTTFFPTNPLPHSAPALAGFSYLQVQATGSNSFQVSLRAPVYSAAEYLDWTEPLAPDFDVVRQALERPFARIDGDYEQPFSAPVPNYVRLRTAVQILAQRAQCYLLLGQPEAAWRELALIRELGGIPETKPPGKPKTLVGAMIDVAVTGLHVSVVQDGLRLHAWREPQLLAIERQLATADLLTLVVAAFKEERAAASSMLNTASRRELIRLSNFAPGKTWRDKLEYAKSTVALACLPRGWLYQSMAAGAVVHQEFLEGVDVTNRLVHPRRMDAFVSEVQARLDRRSPYAVFVDRGFSNFSKAVHTLASTQTLVDEARIACALERYRLAQGQYPETLDTLVPRFMEKIPRDLIGGQPLKYRRTEGGYVLYSIGWDEKDGGGFPGKSREEGDWVWKL